jgi:hypothetical protein
MYSLILCTAISWYKKLIDNTNLFVSATVKGKGKGKAIPLQAWTGPDVSRRLRLPDFKTIGT